MNIRKIALVVLLVTIIASLIYKNTPEPIALFDKNNDKDVSLDNDFYFTEDNKHVIFDSYSDRFIFNTLDGSTVYDASKIDPNNRYSEFYIEGLYLNAVLFTGSGSKPVIIYDTKSGKEFKSTRELHQNAGVVVDEKGEIKKLINSSGVLFFNNYNYSFNILLLDNEATIQIEETNSDSIIFTFNINSYNYYHEDFSLEESGDIVSLKIKNQPTNCFLNLSTKIISYEDKEILINISNKKSKNGFVPLSFFQPIKEAHVETDLLNIESGKYEIKNISKNEKLCVIYSFTGKSGIYSIESVKRFNLQQYIKWSLQLILILAFIVLLRLEIIAINKEESYENTSHREKTCNRCKKQVPLSSAVGEYCPHCGALWGDEVKKGY